MKQEQDPVQAGQFRETCEMILRVENLNKTYSIPNGKLQVLHDVNLQLRRVEV